MDKTTKSPIPAKTASAPKEEPPRSKEGSTPTFVRGTIDPTTKKG